MAFRGGATIEIPDVYNPTGYQVAEWRLTDPHYGP